MLPILVKWYKAIEVPSKKVNSTTKIKEKDWLDLDVEDLRYQYAYCKGEGLTVVERLEKNGDMFDLDSWVAGY